MFGAFPFGGGYFGQGPAEIIIEIGPTEIDLEGAVHGPIEDFASAHAELVLAGASHVDLSGSGAAHVRITGAGAAHAFSGAGSAQTTIDLEGARH